MTISLYSFLMAIFLFNIFILIGTFLRHKIGFILYCRPISLLLLLSLTIFRLFAPFEVHFTRIIHSTVIYPALQSLLQKQWISIGSITISGMYTLLGLWIFTAVFLCIKLYLRLHHDTIIIKTLPTIECSNANECLKNLLSRRKKAPRVKLIVTPYIKTPMLTGILEPKILLPQACANLPPKKLECILAHELAHLYGGDIKIKFLVRIFCYAIWWNPFVYLLQIDLDCILEYKCDLNTTKDMNDNDKLQYLQTILTILNYLEEYPLSKDAQTLQLGFSGLAEKSIIKTRFQLILMQEQKNKHFFVATFAIISLLFFVMSYSIALQPASKPSVIDLAGEMNIVPETSYVFADSNGTYYLIYHEAKIEKLSFEMLQEKPYCYLSIQNKEN